MTIEGRVNVRLQTIKELEDRNEDLFNEIKKLEKDVEVSRRLIDEFYDLIDQNNEIIKKLKEMPDE